MYVRWKRRKLKHATAYDAILVECKRINGKPSQRFIGTLAMFHPFTLLLGKQKDAEPWVKDRALREREKFWRRARSNLDHYGIPEGDSRRGKLEATLAAKVPDLTPDERKQIDKERAEFKKHAEMGRMLLQSLKTA